jgi:hypothetical protein
LKKQVEKSMEGLGNVDQIREIIFGSQMRELNQRFSKLETALTAQSKQFESLLDDTKSQLGNEISSNMELLETKLKNLSALSQAERDAIKEELGRNDKRLNMAIHSQNEEQTTKLSLLKKEFTSESERLKAEMRTLKETIFDELEKQLGSMGDVKVSRDAMAEVLLEMAMKIKGEGIDLPLDNTQEGEKA